MVQIEMGPDMTIMVINKPYGLSFQKETKIKGQRLQAVENFRIISSEGSEPEILSMIAQTTAAV